MSVRGVLWVLSSAAIVLTAHAGALERLTESLPELAPPPQGETQWVAKSMRVNGLPMTLQAFRSRLRPDAVFHHYESWARSRGGAASVRSSNGAWQVLSIRLRGSHISIQALATAEGSHGTIAASPDLEAAEARIETGFPIPPTAKIVNIQQYDDLGMESEHIGLLSHRAASIEARAFANLLSRQDWQVIRDHASRTIRRGHVLEAQKGAQHASLTFVPHRSNASMTAVIVIWKKT